VPVVPWLWTRFAEWQSVAALHKPSTGEAIFAMGRNRLIQMPESEISPIFRQSCGNHPIDSRVARHRGFPVDRI
jgi:hypothetical protein